MTVASLPEPPVDKSSGYQTLRYIAPFLAFMGLLFLAERLPLAPAWEAALRLLVLGVICALCWPAGVPVRPARPFLSCLVGLAVFFLWIAPDLLIPGYRTSPLFANSLVGHLRSSLSADALRSPWLLGWRTARAVLIVPVVEELFWRGWMMRWIINPDFERVRFGTYAPAAFWITAVLFASEHGPYWDVGLLTGIIYNIWMIRTKSLADCILVHAVTNAALSAYVISTHQWQYWQ